MAELTKKIVLITGASAGIGRACAIGFSEAGARVIVVARRSSLLKELCDSLPNESLALNLDIRDPEEVVQAISELAEPWQAIDILVNNAGLGRGLDKLHEGDITGWHQMIDINIKGLLHISRAILPGMVDRKRGHVINIGSIAGHEVYPGGNVYCATKHAVDAITKGMRIDLVDTPIRVSTVDPGLVKTDFSLVRFDGNAERADQVYQGYTPLTGEDIADAVLWVASRPQHVQIAQITVLPTAQASTQVVHKKA